VELYVAAQSKKVSPAIAHPPLFGEFRLELPALIGAQQ
jgi:hypothetical protein